MGIRHWIANFVVLLFAQPAMSCAFDENLAALLSRDLASKTGVQTAEFPSLRDGSSVSINLRYASNYGTPKITEIGGQLTISLPRSYFVEMFGWADALAVCSIGECKDLPKFVQAYKIHSLATNIPTWINVLGNDPAICEKRATAEYSQKINAYLQFGMMFIQMHEIGHAALGHLKGVDWSEDQEAEADALAVHVIKTAFPQNLVFARSASVAILPLMHRKYRSSFDSVLACRLEALLGDDAKDIMSPTSDCAAYRTAFEIGMQKAENLIGPETVLLVKP